MLPFVGMAIAGGVNSLAQWYAKKRQLDKSKFGNTAYAQRLQEIQRQGIISPTEQSKLLGDVSKETAQVTGNAIEQYRQQMAGMNLDNSIASAGREAQISAQRADKIADVTKDIDVANIQSKETAKDQYAMAKTQYNERLNQLKNQNTMQLLQGLGSIGQQAVSKWAGDKAYNKALSGLDVSDPGTWTDFLQNVPDKQFGTELLTGLSKSQYYAGRQQKSPFSAQWVIEFLNQNGSTDETNNMLWGLYNSGLLNPDAISLIEQFGK